MWGKEGAQGGGRAVVTPSGCASPGLSSPSQNVGYQGGGLQPPGSPAAPLAPISPREPSSPAEPSSPPEPSCTVFKSKSHSPCSERLGHLHGAGSPRPGSQARGGLCLAPPGPVSLPVSRRVSMPGTPPTLGRGVATTRNRPSGRKPAALGRFPKKGRKEGRTPCAAAPGLCRGSGEPGRGPRPGGGLAGPARPLAAADRPSLPRASCASRWRSAPWRRWPSGGCATPPR